MRTLLLALTATLALAGCSTMRHASGSVGRLADKGVGGSTGDAAPTKPAASKAAPLPGGLTGDGQTHVYAEVPRSS